MTFADIGIETRGKTGQLKTLCPQCSHTRKTPKDPCLSVNTETGTWHCHHCQWHGKLGGAGLERTAKTYQRPLFTASPMVHPQLVEWFRSRGIGVGVLERAKVKLTHKYFAAVGGDIQAIQFPYFRGGVCVNIKSRGLEQKVFTQEAHAEKVFYGLDDLALQDWAVIVEGEMDKLSFAEAGLWNVLSVPDGAPPEHSKPSDAKFEFIPNCELDLSPLAKIILAVDNDGPGHTLEEELARRIGPERCWRVSWPPGMKDANAFLLAYGAEALRNIVEQATPWPIAGLVEPATLVDDVEALYLSPQVKGLGTGWLTVDQLYTVKAGDLTVVTGIPGSGKSEWLDALAVNLADDHGWRMAFCSPENWPIAEHAAKLLEKIVRKPFRVGPTVRMGWADLANGLQWMQDHIVFFSPPEDDMTVQAVLRLARMAVTRYGIRGLVIDPWNEFEHQRGAGQSETEYIGETLTLIRRFARKHGVATWVVAHPTKLKKLESGAYPCPTPYDINGSSNWRNKADNCLTVHRDAEDEESLVQLHVQKIRWRHVGKIGMAELRWNPVNGRYSDV